MSKLPVLRPKDLARIVRKLGFVLDRQKRSHPILAFPQIYGVS
jgi:predicted RNA binding protein YcfA (HicA-like mRNA interferase family)